MPTGTESSRNPQDARRIHQWLDDFESQRHSSSVLPSPSQEVLNQRHHYTQPADVHPLHLATSRRRSATSTIPSEAMTTRTMPSRMMSTGTTSTISSLSHSHFDDAMSAYSTVTAASTVPEDIGVDDTPYYCEFRGYTGCDRVFGADQFEAWVQHIAGDHMRYKLPRKSICWHCDRIQFQAKSGAQNDLMDCFHIRMVHIARHLRVDAVPMRPDFLFAEHIFQLGLIDQEMLDRIRSWHELPESLRSKVNTDLPPVREAPSRVIVESNERKNGRGKHRGRSGRSRVSQQYYQ